MAWTPKRTDERVGAAEGSASPAPRRRRRAPQPDTPKVDAAVAASPRTSTNARPRGGVNVADAAVRGEDTRSRDVFVRVGKRWAEIINSIKKGEQTWASFVEGLDEEELARGQLRDMDGGFKGRPPSLVPREFHLACQREMRRRFEELFQKDVITVAQMYLQLAQSPNLKEETRAKMLQYCMERVFGGIPKDVRVQTEQPWEQMLANVVRGEDQDEMPAHLQERYARYKERTGEGAED